ncbi:zinc-alpha-2-glycoprotein-like [Onychomys torridus]|uniref:zinc-alpha-2-glycoprotein-like n=1 Tax=Onychomys torridus TaxID=38674 RepID=UPI00167FCF2E|nr:zinc-alpha-2-glycoprotein-like [Onychomys torridus]
MALSLQGSRKFEFRAQGYIDNELFLRYDGERTRTEPCGPRIKGQGGAEMWARETEDMQEKEEQLRRMLSEVMTQKGQHGVSAWYGIHTLQETFGCEIQGNNTGGFWCLGYDGQDFLTFDQKIQMWKVSVPSAYSSKTFWERHGPSVDQVKTFLNDICPDHLQRYSIYLENQLMDTGPPQVTVSRRPYPVGRITLTCWAFNLNPPVATLAWLQHGKTVQQHTFGPGTILPSGDGTYQTWVSIWVLPGQEPHFTCRLRHLSKTIDVPTALEYGASIPPKGVGGRVGKPQWSTITTAFMVTSRTSSQENWWSHQLSFCSCGFCFSCHVDISIPGLEQQEHTGQQETR